MGTQTEDLSWTFDEYGKILDYKIIQGLPGRVEHEVKILLLQDWQPNGEMYKIKVQDNDIVVQCMVLYKKHALC